MRFPRRIFRSAWLALAGSLLLSASFAVRTEAALIVGNLGEEVRDATPIASPEYWGAQSFVPDVNYLLTSIVALMGNASGDPNAVIELRAALGPGEIDLSAGGLLTTFSIPDLSGALAARTFTPNSAITLQGGELYWFVVGATSGGFEWAYAVNNVTAGPGVFGNYADSDDAGATFVNKGNDFPYLMEVHGEVPEPGTLALVALGLLGLGARSRRA